MPCLLAITAKKRLAYNLGGWIIELDQCPQTGACRGWATRDRTYFAQDCTGTGNDKAVRSNAGLTNPRDQRDQRDV